MIDRERQPQRPATSGAIGTLIRCACGHVIGVHTRAGCFPGSREHCACRVADSTVLDHAIAQAAIELQAAMRPDLRRDAR